MLPLQTATETAPIGAELLRTVSSVEFIFGATTALAFQRTVRDMVRSRLLGTSADDGSDDGSGDIDRSRRDA